MAIAVVLFAVTTTAAARMSRPLRESPQLIGSAMALKGGADLTGRQRLADIVRSEVMPQRARSIARFGDRSDRHQSWLKLRSGLDVPIFALLGLALSRSRGWGLAVRAVAMMTTWYALGRWAVPVLDVLIVPIRGWPDPALQALPRSLIPPLVAATFLVRRPGAGRAAQARA